jgi:hypothetical protein
MMTNPNVPEGAKLLAWIAITWLAMRSFSICTFVFLFMNLNIGQVAAIEVYTKVAATPSSRTCRNATRRPNEQGNQATTPSPRNHGKPTSKRLYPSIVSDKHQVNVPSSLPKGTHHSRRQQYSTPPPPPYSVDPPSSDDKQPTAVGIIELYEDIIASDSQTIQVQQQTLASQQDIIRSQAQMIVKLRHLLEEQDRRIEDLDEVARGLRVRRPGFDAGMRSRSA